MPHKTGKGQFYVDEGYPKGTVESEANLDPAKVFRYTSIEVVNIPFEYPPEFDTTLVLSYSAIGCTCPQWTPLRDAVDSLKVYYYLERGDTTLLDALSCAMGLPKLEMQIKMGSQLLLFGSI